MPPLLLLATLAWGGDAHPIAGSTPSRRPGTGDLAVESALTRLGLPREEAVHTVATWTGPIAAPARSRAEGRAKGWAFNRTQAQVRQTQLSDGATLVDRATVEEDDPHVACMRLNAPVGSPLTLAPVEAALAGGADRSGGSETHQRGWTVVEQQGSRTFMVPMRPGDSALVVEIEDRGRARDARRARTRRRVALQTDHATIDLAEGTDGASLCVTAHRSGRPAPRTDRPGPRRPAPDPKPPGQDP